MADLRPRGDALEYEEAARSLLRGDGYALVLAGAKYPPCHPFGFSALVALGLAVEDEGPGSGIRAVLASALVAVAATWALGAAAGGPWAGAVAAGLLAVDTLHVRWSRAVMSDVSASAAAALLAVWVLSALRRAGRPLEWLLLGGAAALAGSIRSPILLLLVPAAALLGTSAGTRRERGARVAGLACGVLLGLLPMMAYNTLRFGAPWHDGIELCSGGEQFGWKIVVSERGGGAEPNWIFYPRQLAGLGSLYPWPAAVLVVLGAAVALRRGGSLGADARRLAVLALGFTVLVVLLHVPIAWQWSRYLLLVLPLLLALAATAVAPAEPLAVRVVGALLTAGTLALTLRAPEAFAPPDPPIGEVAALRAIDDAVEPNAAVLAAASTVLFERVVRARADRVLVPFGVDPIDLAIALGRRRPYARTGADGTWLRERPPPNVSIDELARLIRALQAEGRPVYLSMMLRWKAAAIGTYPALLARSFRLESVPQVGSPGLYRVRDPAES